MAKEGWALAKDMGGYGRIWVLAKDSWVAKEENGRWLRIWVAKEGNGCWLNIWVAKEGCECHPSPMAATLHLLASCISQKYIYVNMEREGAATLLHTKTNPGKILA